MSKLDELINKHCFSGVEFKELKLITRAINIGINPRKFFKLNPENASGFYVTVRELNGLLGVKQYDKTDLIDSDAIKIINSRANIECGDILFSNTGTVGKMALVISDPTNWGVNEGIYVIKPMHDIINSKFLFYYLESSDAKQQSKKKLTGSTLKHITQEALSDIKIPVPPLPVQEEIVRILDKFTELEAELAQELARRKLQYTFYRDQLLNFESKSKAQWLNLENCCKILDNKRKPVSKSDRENGIYPYYGANGIQDYVSDYIFDGDFVLVGEDGSVITKDGNPVVNWASGKIWVNNHAHIIEATDGVLLRYLFHYLQTVNVKHLIHGNIPKLTGKNFKEIKIPVPSIDIQQRLINVLDKFDAICSDLSIGLPAEIAAREKQYNYYRDLLFNYAADMAGAQQSTTEHNRAEVDCVRVWSEEVRMIQYVFGCLKVQLSDVANYSKDRVACKKLNDSTYVSVENLLQDKMGKTNSLNIPDSGNAVKFVTDDVLVGNIRPYLKKIWFANCDGGTNGDVLVIRSYNKSMLFPKYLYHVLASDKFFHYDMSHSKGAKMPRGDKAAILEYKFYLPPIEEQRRIVNILDRFDMLCNDISAGLPAEIEMRQKQYEYYRDKLLTFKELS